MTTMHRRGGAAVCKNATKRTGINTRPSCELCAGASAAVCAGQQAGRRVRGGRGQRAGGEHETTFMQHARTTGSAYGGRALEPNSPIHFVLGLTLTTQTAIASVVDQIK